MTAPLSRARAAARTLLIAGALAIAAVPAAADDQDKETGRPLDREYFEEQIDREMRAAIENLIAAFGPIFQQFTALIEDIPQYEAPKILPNGDIIIRRKRPLDEVET